MCFINKIKSKRESKRQAKEDEFMFGAVVNMLGYRFSQESFVSNISRFMADEIDSLITGIKTSPYESGYEKYLIHSIQKHPDRVFHINCHSLVKVGEPDVDDMNSHITKQIPELMIRDGLVLFLYTDFRFPETYLAARAGYVIFYPRVNQIVASYLPLMS